MKQQKLIVSKNKYKILPNELFVDIFKAINTLPFEIINWKIEINNNNYSNIIIQKLFKYWWNKYVKNILNSSSIIYINISKAFLKRMRMNRNPPPIFEFNGQAFEPDNCWNLNDRIILELNQNLITRPGTRLNAITNAIVNKIIVEKKPHSNVPLFNICCDEPKLLDVRENFEMLCIGEGEEVRSSVYYINKNICIRNWIYGNLPGILRRVKNFVVYGDVYSHQANNTALPSSCSQMLIVRTYSREDLHGVMNPLPLFTDHPHDIYVREKNQQPSHSIHTTGKLSSLLHGYADKLFSEIGLQQLSKENKDNFPVMYPYVVLRKFYQGRKVDVGGYGILDQHVLDGVGESERVGWSIFLDLHALSFVL